MPTDPFGIYKKLDIIPFCIYKRGMAVTFHHLKRDWTLRIRGLDFKDAEDVFDGPTFSFEDRRQDYGEVRVVTFGLLTGRMVVVGWTPRGEDQHVFASGKQMTARKKVWAATWLRSMPM